jgi:hypothetical protein
MTIFLSFTFSEENYDAFCLAYMFTYRDFEGGTLGLAWTGHPMTAGGACERNGVSSSKGGDRCSWCRLIHRVFAKSIDPMVLAI